MKIHTALKTLQNHGFETSFDVEQAPNLLTGNPMCWGKIVAIKDRHIISQSICFPPSALLEKQDILRVNGWRLRHETDKDMVQADYFAGISGLTLGKAIKMVG